MKESKRIELSIDFSFPVKFFDLNRCLNLIRYGLVDKELVRITTHLSAYDKCGEYSHKQIALLNELMAKNIAKETMLSSMEISIRIW